MIFVLVAHLPIIKSLQRSCFSQARPAFSPSTSRPSSPHPQAGRGRPTAQPRTPKSAAAVLPRTAALIGGGAARSGERRLAIGPQVPRRGGRRGYIRRERRQRSVVSRSVVAENGRGGRGAARSHSRPSPPVTAAAARSARGGGAGRPQPCCAM